MLDLLAARNGRRRARRFGADSGRGEDDQQRRAAAPGGPASLSRQPGREAVRKTARSGMDTISAAGGRAPAEQAFDGPRRKPDVRPASESISLWTQWDARITGPAGGIPACSRRSRSRPRAHCSHRHSPAASSNSITVTPPGLWHQTMRGAAAARRKTNWRAQTTAATVRRRAFLVSFTADTLTGSPRHCQPEGERLQ